MSWGTRVINPSGALQIDENFVNLALAYKGSLRTGNLNAAGYAFANKTISGTGLVVALSSDNPVGMVGLTESGGNTTLAVNSDTANSLVEYYVFREAELGQNFNSNYGIRTRNSSGQVVFDSRKKYMSVRDSFYYQETQSVPWNSRSYGGKVAIIFTQWYTSVDIFPSPTNPGRETVVTSWFAAKTPGNRCDVNQFTTIQESNAGSGSGVSVAYSGMPRARSFLVVDVSKF